MVIDAANLSRMSHTIHRQLAERYAGDTGLTEVKVARFVVDVVVDGRFVEVQLGSFHKISRKLQRLCEVGPTLLVFPVAREKRIVKLEPGSDAERSRRRSPRRGSALDIIPELPWICDLIPRESFAVDVVLTREDEYRRDCRRGRHWRRKYEIVDRELLSVVRTVRLEQPTDYLRLLPRRLRQPFTNTSLAPRLGRHRRIARTLTSSLRKMGVVEPAGRTPEGIRYVIVEQPPVPRGGARAR
jgi:hypothetical protein